MFEKINITYKYSNVSTGLVKTKLPEYTYSINPYFGCSYACIYCYAMKYFYIKKIPYEWGTYVEIKKNLPSIVKKEAKRLSSGDTVGIGISTDPYQPIENKEKITREIIKILSFKRNVSISVQTKSTLILKDLDLFQNIDNLDIGFTITTIDEKLARLLEPYAPKPRARLNALKRLSDNGIYTWVFIGPVMPYLTDNINNIKRIVLEAYNAGAKKIYMDNLRFRLGVKDNLLKHLYNWDSEIYNKYKTLTYNELYMRYKKTVKIARYLALDYGLDFEDVGYLPFKGGLYNRNSSLSKGYSPPSSGNYLKPSSI